MPLPPRRRLVIRHARSGARSARYAGTAALFTTGRHAPAVAIARVTMMSDGPAAVPADGEVQDTVLSWLRPAATGLGLGRTRQAVPFHVSASASGPAVVAKYR